MDDTGIGAAVERRSAERFAVIAPIAIKGETAITRDVSTTGICFETTLSLTEGEAITWRMLFGGGTADAGRFNVECQGDVVRVTPIERKLRIGARITEIQFLDAMEASNA